MAINADLQNILVAGDSGSGKSTLINCFLTEKIDTSNQKLCEGNTTEVQSYEANLNDINVKFWDVPGLPNMKEQEVKEKYLGHDILIYCVKCIGIQYRNIVKSLQEVTERYTMTIWKNAIIAFTFANTLEDIRLEWNNPRKEFDIEIMKLKKKIMDILRPKVSQEILETIHFIPVGLTINSKLPNGACWSGALAKKLEDQIKFNVAVGSDSVETSLTNDDHKGLLSVQQSEPVEKNCFTSCCQCILT